LGVYIALLAFSIITQLLVTPLFSEMVDPFPDLSLRQPSVTVVFPLFLSFYAMAVLAILPNTFLFKLLLQPVFVWQAWRCVADVDFSAWLAQSLGLKNVDSIDFLNTSFVVR
jgi:hypothetical protein